jgi:tetratricopeptide (TPR) repeat protein
MRLFTKLIMLVIALLAFTDRAQAAKSNVSKDVKACEDSLKESDYPNAVINGKVAVRLNPNNIKANLCLANALNKSGKKEDALKALDIAERYTKKKAELKEIYELSGKIKADVSASSPSDSSVPEKGKGTAFKSATIDFVTTDNCTTSSSDIINMEFYLKGNTTYHWGPFQLQYAGKPLHSKLNCNAGEVICYGAWSSESNVTWGCGQGCKEIKESACYKCDDVTQKINFECR